MNEDIIVKHIEKLNYRLDDINEKIMKIREDIVALKVRSSLWGGIMGSIMSAVGAIIYAFHGK